MKYLLLSLIFLGGCSTLSTCPTKIAKKAHCDERQLCTKVVAEDGTVYKNVHNAMVGHSFTACESMRVK